MKTNLYRSAIEGLTPDPVLKVWEWADKFRYLTSESAAEPGLYRTNRVPYAREIMDALSVNNPAREVIVQKGSQLGLSEVGNNWIGYIIDSVPAPTLCVQPTLTDVNNYSRGRIDVMIRASPALVYKVQEAKSREAGNTLLRKEFKGGFLMMTSGNAASGLASTPIRNLFLDEVDRYSKNVSGEGSPIALATARTQTFQNKKKIYKISTPTIEGSSAIVAEFETSSKEKFWVPCPFCEEIQVLEFSQLRYEAPNYKETVHYECIHCQGKIEEWQKPEMLDAGRWIAEHPERYEVRGFFINSLYAPYGWCGWWELASDYDKALEDPEKMKAFVNTKLGLPYRESGETPDFQRLYERRESYSPRMLALGAKMMTAGIDVQLNRVEIMVVGWNENKEKWLIDYKVIVGDVEEDEVWDEAETYLNSEWPVFGSKLKVQITGFCIDGGYSQPRVAAFARRFPKTKCYVIKGTPNGVSLVGKPRDMDITQNGKTIKTGLRIWNVYPDIAKGEIYRQLVMPVPQDGDLFPKGYFHFHKDCDLEFFQGLCSEELRSKIVNGFPVYFYHKVFRRNEPLDCANYARFAFHILGAERWDDKTWKDIGDSLKVTDEEIEADIRRFQERIVEVSLVPRVEAVPAGSTPAERKVENIEPIKKPPEASRQRRKSSYW